MDGALSLGSGQRKMREWGCCLTSGEEIAVVRLQHDPSVTECVECARKLGCLLTTTLQTFRQRVNKVSMIGRCIAFMLMLGGCQPAAEHRPVEQIELRQSGWESLDVSVTSTGIGSFERTGIAPGSKTGSFRMTSSDFKSLGTRLSEFRDEAV
ncbi:MAG: hypothetical protein U0988_06380, partial [Allopontixanthobacter sp.]|nr:hypothetical protein [Allopontixanthobacter sp.]